MTEREPVIFELIDLASGNVVIGFAHASDALESIRRLARTHGWDSVRNLALLRVEGDSQSLVAMEEELTALAASQELTTTSSPSLGA